MEIEMKDIPDDAARIAPDLVPGLLEAARIAVDHACESVRKCLETCSVAGCEHAARADEAWGIAFAIRARAEARRAKAKEAFGAE